MLLSALVLAALSPPHHDDSVVFVERGRPVAVIAEHWKREGRYFTGAGKGHDLLTEQGVGTADFAIEAVLAIEKLNSTAAAFRLGDSWFGFDGKGETIYTNGALFGGGVKLHGPASTYIRDGRDFRFSVVRTDGELVVSIDGVVVISARSHAALHPLGFQPTRARLFVRSFEASGDVRAPEEALPPGHSIPVVDISRDASRQARELVELQPAINSAIDGGVEFLLSTQLRDGSWGAYMPKFRGGQTALAAYTLLNTGLRPSHPSVERALLFLERHEPHDTYTLALQLMAFGATNDEGYHQRMEELVERLVEWRVNSSWGYPWGYKSGRWSEAKGRPDLSNTQFAALGLRAAHKAGLKIDPRVWLQTIEDTLAWKAPEETVSVTVEKGRSSTGEEVIGGFIYRHKGGFPATLTMTEAGITVLATARDALGKRLRGKARRKVDRAIDNGFAWICHRFALTNVGATGDPWNYYHLYGIERVGSLLDEDVMGSHHWYLEGARYLVGKQAKNGSWTDQHAEPDTCFAVLFLERATRPSSGARAQAERTGKDLHTAEDDSNALRIRGLGNRDLALFVTGFARGDPHVARVDYLVDGEVVATVEGNAKRAWTGDRFVAKHRFERAGTYRVTARAHLADGTLALCLGFDVTVDRVDGAWSRSAATAAERNLLKPSNVSATASSTYGKNHASNAVDGWAATRWLSTAKDANPTLTLELARAVRAAKLVLGQADASHIAAGQCDRVLRVEITINGRAPFEVDLDPDGVRPTEILLPRAKKVKRIRLRILAREKGARWPGLAGFAQVALEKD